MIACDHHSADLHPVRFQLLQAEDDARLADVGDVCDTRDGLTHGLLDEKSSRGVHKFGVVWGAYASRTRAFLPRRRHRGGMKCSARQLLYQRVKARGRHGTSVDGQTEPSCLREPVNAADAGRTDGPLQKEAAREREISMQSQALTTVKICSDVTALLYVSGLVLLGSTAVWAQVPAASPPAQHATTDAEKNKQLADQIAELRAQVARLQAAQQSAPAKKDTPAAGMRMPPAKPMGMMDHKGEMGMAPKGAQQTGKAAMPAGRAMGMPMKDDGEDEMGGMPAGGTGAMSSAPAAAMGMCCMGEMGAMPGAASGSMRSGAAPAQSGMAGMNAPSSAMPGQPGASHLYHVGSTGFFLNHPQHITLTADQKTVLNRVKEKAMLDRASDQRQIDQAEQELYTLTGADSFDNAKVQAKVADIERLRAGQRINFIKAVGEASNVLTHDQHQALIGTMPANKK